MMHGQPNIKTPKSVLAQNENTEFNIA